MDDAQQIALDRGQVHVVAQALGERVGGPSGVVPGPIEPTVHHHLDASPQRLEEREDDEGRAGHCERAAPGDRAEHRGEADHEADERDHEDAGDGRPRDRAADDPIDLIEPIAQDGDGDRDRDADQADHRP